MARSPEIRNRNAEIVRIHLEGVANCDIARVIGVNTNIVAGVLNRWRVKNNIAPPQRIINTPPVAEARVKERAPEVRDTHYAGRGRVAPGTMPGIVLDSFEAQVEAGSCLYIGGDPRAGDAQYCGESRARGSRFCAVHHKLCHRRNQPGPLRDE